MFVRKGLLAAAGIVLGCCFTASGWAQGKQLTTEDYARAEKFMAYNVNPLVYHGVARPTWMDDGRFWYRDSGPDGVTFVVVDPAKGNMTPFNARSGSVVGRPSWSSAHPSGIDLPSFAAMRIWPRAAMLLAMSMVHGEYRPAGADTA